MVRTVPAFLLWAVVASAEVSVADLARGIREIALDPEACYRIRDLNLAREDARFYFTDGYLIFAKPIAGRRTAAIFTAETDGGDAEVLLMPPNRGERRSLAAFAHTPNLDEHFGSAVLTFTDNTYEAVVEQIRQNPFNRRMPERGVLMTENWTPVVRNISGSFETRLVLDLLTGVEPGEGFFVATVSGRKLGNFDVSYDPRAAEQIVVGQLVVGQNRTSYDIWTSFRSHSARNTHSEPDIGFAVAEYRIDATLDPGLVVRGVSRLRVKTGSRPLKVLPLDISSRMKISAVSVAGRPAEIFERDSMRLDLMRNLGNSLFLVITPEPLEPGREYEIEFRQEGQVVFDAGNHVFYVGARGNWYPNPGMQFSVFDIAFRYPKELDLVTPGDVVEDRTEGEWRITRRRTPVPIRLAGFNLGRYERVRISRGEYTIEAYANRGLEKALQPKPEAVVIAPPSMWPRNRRPDPVATLPEPQPHPASRLQELASDVAGALEFMSSRFGPPALKTLTVSPVPGTFGQGFPGLIYLSTLAYFGRDEKPMASLDERQQVFFSEILHAHETAHQWWGNVVVSAGYHDDWLMEALANYSALLYLEKRKGPRSLESALENYKTGLLLKSENGQTIESAGPIVLGTRLTSSQEPRAWRLITYGKGSWILHMLRRSMGDERFMNMLAELRRRYALKPVDTEQFRLLAAEFLPPKSSDPQLAGFFDQWVYGTGIPDLRLTYSLKGKAPNLKLAGKLTQSDVPEDFSAPVPVVIQFGRGAKPITTIVHSANEPVEFAVAVRQLPVKVLLDPGGSVLRR